MPTSPTTTLTLTLTDSVTKASFTTSTAINIPTTVGSGKAYVGFTAGTGGGGGLNPRNFKLDLRRELGKGWEG